MRVFGQFLTEKTIFLSKFLVIFTIFYKKLYVWEFLMKNFFRIKISMFESFWVKTLYFRVSFTWFFGKFWKTLCVRVFTLLWEKNRKTLPWNPPPMVIIRATFTPLHFAHITKLVFAHYALHMITPFFSMDQCFTFRTGSCWIIIFHGKLTQIARNDQKTYHCR